MPKVGVDKELCISCGTCWVLAPQVFEEDPNTMKTRIKEPYRRVDNEKESIGEVPPELASDAKSAADACPASAIKVE